MSYRDPKAPRWLTRGSAWGCGVAILAIIVGWPLLFARLWNCNHRETGSAPCPLNAGRPIAVAILVIAVALFLLTKWAFDRRDNSTHD